MSVFSQSSKPESIESKEVKVQKSMDCPNFTSSNTRSKLRSGWYSEGIYVFGKKCSHRGNRENEKIDAIVYWELDLIPAVF